MIELKDAQEQMNRMIGLKFGPRASQQRQEVLRVMRTARTVLILGGAVTSWIDGQVEFPKPAELRQIIEALNAAHDEAVGKARTACTACGGSGWVEMRGANSFDSSIVTGSRACICRTAGQPVVADRDACATCQGHGFYGGVIGGRFAGAWKWCDCAAGRERQVHEPNLIAEANVAREKCIRAPMPRRKGFQPVGAHLEPYHGTF